MHSNSSHYLQPLCTCTKTTMTLKNLSSVFVLVYVLLTSHPSLAIIGIKTDALGARLCDQTPANLSSCSPVEELKDEFGDFYKYINVTSPRIVIEALSEGFFNVRFKNGQVVQKVRYFVMMAEEAEVDIDLLNTSTGYSIGCFSFRSFSKVSSNVLTSPDTALEVKHLNFHYPDVFAFSSFYLLEKKLQSGHFSCRSIGEPKKAETVRIFTQSSAQNDKSPFLDVQELTIQNDKKVNGYIVPCRTNYRLESQPSLLWKKLEQDNFTTLTEDELKRFKWDPRVGFAFNSSDRMWEMQIIACQFGSFQKSFLPTPSRFQRTTFVTAERNEIGCRTGPRHDSTNLLLPSVLKFQKFRYHECYTSTQCDLLLESGLHLSENRQNSTDKNASDMETMDRPNKFGVLSCYLQHLYEGKHVPEIVATKFFLGLDSKVYLLPGPYPNSSVIQISGADDQVFYKGNTELYHVLTCTTINFVTSDRGYLILRRKNLTETVYEDFIRSEAPKLSSETRFNVTLDKDVTHAVCLCLTQDGKVMSAETTLNIVDAFPPLVNNATTSLRNLKVGDLTDSLTLTCPITGGPPPTYRWLFNTKNANLVHGVDTRNLTFRHISNKLAGIYTCQAWNQYGNNSFEFQVSVQPQDIKAWIALGIGTLLCLILFCASVVFAVKYFRAKRQMRNLTPEEAEEFLKGIPITEGASHDDGSQLARYLPFTKCIESNSLLIARDMELGQGQYGVVYRGSLHGEAVAVKTFKHAVTYDEFQAGLVEVKLMNFVGEHPNIVRFIGADVTNIEKRVIFIVMELSPVGSLREHLRLLKPSSQSDLVRTSNSQYTTVDDKLEQLTLLGFCEQIASAMEYLESKKVIHGDLATRNVLAFSHGVVKVTDFGYSRQLYESTTYKPKKHRAVPWRWASIELLRELKFSTESDIWAFGVTVWEIFTFGNVPFASEMWNEHFMESMEKGLRLRKPAGLSEYQYSFLRECWSLERSARPRFSEWKSFFSKEKENLRSGYETIEVHYNN